MTEEIPSARAPVSLKSRTEEYLATMPGRWAHVGSRVTCCPIPLEADYDYLVEDAGTLKASLLLAGFTLEGEDAYAGSSLQSYRKELVNIIVVNENCHRFFNSFILASRVAKQLNLIHKKNRIVLFQAILYDEDPEATVDVSNA